MREAQLHVHEDLRCDRTPRIRDFDELALQPSCSPLRLFLTVKREDAATSPSNINFYCFNYNLLLCTTTQFYSIRVLSDALEQKSSLVHFYARFDTPV